jgi:excisionase family DNA binding protein
VTYCPQRLANKIKGVGMVQDIQQRLLTVKEASRYLCISERTLFAMTKENLIPAVRLKRAVRYDINDLDKFIELAKNKTAIDQ